MHNISLFEDRRHLMLFLQSVCRDAIMCNYRLFSDLNEVIDCIKVRNLDYMLHVRTLRDDAFLANILMNLRKLLLRLCFKLTKT